MSAKPLRKKSQSVNPQTKNKETTQTVTKPHRRSNKPVIVEKPEPPARVQIPTRPQRTVSEDVNYRLNGEVAELKKMVKELSQKKEGRKLSALNKLKKYVLSKSTEQALAETDFSDLIPVDKMRLLNKAYPIVWNQLVLQPLFKKYNCTSEEEKKKLTSKRNIQLEYNIIVDNIIDEMKSGELDDQEHFREDITAILASAIKTATKEFASGEEEKEEEVEYDDEVENEYDGE